MKTPAGKPPSLQRAAWEGPVPFGGGDGIPHHEGETMKIDNLHAETVLEVATRLAAAYVGSHGIGHPSGLVSRVRLVDMGPFAQLARELVEASVLEGKALAAQEEP